MVVVSFLLYIWISSIHARAERLDNSGFLPLNVVLMLLRCSLTDFLESRCD